MKAISLWEPWASAMRVGAKRNETRGWPLRYRGPMVICASKHLIDAIGREVMARALQDGFVIDPRPGQAVCVVDVVNCLKMGTFEVDRDSLEYAMGDYGMGRYAWVTRNCRPLKPGLFIAGKQGLFDIPDIDMSVWGEA